MNIVKFEIKRNLKTTLIWAVVISIVAGLYASMAPIFINESDALISYMQSMGDQFVKAVGVDLNTFFTPVGFFGYFGPFVALALGVQAMIYGLKAFVTEKNSNSVEFLYTKPNTRINILVQKYAANIVLLSLTQVIVIASNYVITDMINTVDYDHTLLLLLLCTFIPIQYLFFTLGAVIGVSVNKLKNVVGVSLGVTMMMFFLNMLSNLLGDDKFKYVSFFSYFNTTDITNDGGYDPVFVGLTIAIIVILTIASGLILKKRNMKIV